MWQKNGSRSLEVVGCAGAQSNSAQFECNIQPITLNGSDILLPRTSPWMHFDASQQRFSTAAFCHHCHRIKQHGCTVHYNCAGTPSSAPLGINLFFCVQLWLSHPNAGQTDESRGSRWNNCKVPLLRRASIWLVGGSKHYLCRLRTSSLLLNGSIQ